MEHAVISNPRRKKSQILPLFAVLALLYIFIASRHAPEYPLLIQTETINLPQTTILPKPLQPQAIVPFETADRMGLLNSSNAVAALAVKNGRNVLGPGFYLEAFPDQKKLILDDLFSGNRTELPYYGYPFSRANRIFLLRPDQMGASELDKRGAVRWTREFGTPITAFSAQGSLSAWGTLNGSLAVLDEGGKTFDIGSNLPWNTSAFHAVYGIAISKDQQAFAVIAGYKPLTMTLFVSDGTKFKLARSVKLDGRADTEIPMVFSNDASWLMAALPDCVVILHTQTGRYRQQAQKSAVQSLTPFGQSQISALVRDSNGGKLAIYDKGVEICALPVQKSACDAAEGVNSLILTDELESPGKLRLYRVKK